MKITRKDLIQIIASFLTLTGSVIAAWIVKGWSKAIPIILAIFACWWLSAIARKYAPKKKKKSRAPRREAEPFPTEEEVIVYELLDDDD